MINNNDDDDKDITDDDTGPEIVPDARRSPGFMLQPVIVWWASCCFIVQYMCLKFDTATKQILPFVSLTDYIQKKNQNY